MKYSETIDRTLKRFERESNCLLREFEIRENNIRQQCAEDMKNSHSDWFKDKWYRYLGSWNETAYTDIRETAMKQFDQTINAAIKETNQVWVTNLSKAANIDWLCQPYFRGHNVQVQDVLSEFGEYCDDTSKPLSMHCKHLFSVGSHKREREE